MTGSRIFFVEDDVAYRTEVSDYLAGHGFDVECFDTFPTLERLRETPDAPLVLLDLRVGSQDGINFLRDTLQGKGFPVVVLSGNVDETDRVLSLELGADDFIQKGTRPREILARLRAVIRRSRMPPPGMHMHATERRSRWQFDPARRDLTRPDGSNVPLTTAEFNLLNMLVQHEGKPVSREFLFDRVFNRPFNPLDRAVDNLVAKLRQKLGDSVKEPAMIRTVRPVGYVFTGFLDAPRRPDDSPPG